MKLFHVETKYEGEIKLPERLLNILPSTIMLSGTVQFRKQIPLIKLQLEKTGRKVEMFRGVHDISSGQILGCDIFKIGKKVDAFLYVGDGMFHPTALLYDNDVPVIYYNPFTGDTQILTEKDLLAVKNRKKASISIYTMSERIGILVSTKPGQGNFAGALELKRRLAVEGKQGYLFLNETLDILQLENFPFIQVWVNTACPRIIEDTKLPMINIWDLRDTTMKGFGVKVV